MESQTYQSDFQKGDLLRKQGTPLDSIIYLQEGYVKEYLWHESLPDQVIQLIKPQSYIGLQGLFIDSVSAFSYQAVTDVKVCFIKKTTFSSLIDGNGNFAKEIIISMSKESLSNHKRFLSMNQTQLYGKVSGLLIYLSEEVYENENFEIQLSRSELAQMIGSTRESVTKALIWFHKEGIINLEKNKISILEKSRLADLAKRG
jgi:CRP-like cAMP-binding protein